MDQRQREDSLCIQRVSDPALTIGKPYTNRCAPKNVCFRDAVAKLLCNCLHICEGALYWDRIESGHKLLPNHH
jgi:hypothetical protein